MTVLAQAAADTAAGGASTGEQVVFWVFAVLALGSGLAVITLRNIVHAALMLVLNLLSIAGLYLALESAFLSIVQVLVYAGAIMVLFLFVIMLLGVDKDDLLTVTSKRTAVLATAAVGCLAAALLLGLVGPYTGDAALCDRPGAVAERGECVGLAAAVEAEEEGSVAFIGERLFTRYTFPFELSALLLTVATVGATILGRRRDADPDDEVDADPADLEPADTPDASVLGDGVDDTDEVPTVDVGADGDDATTSTRDREG